MSRVVVLDSAAFDALTAERSSRKGRVRAALEAAERLGRDVVIPAVVLAETYRDRSRSQAADALLAREASWLIRDTDRWMARLVGGILATAGMGTEAMADAHVVAAAVEAGGGVCVTGDTGDLEVLAAGVPSVVIVGID